jgi:uncharacterized protein (TIGR00255 family)
LPKEFSRFENELRKWVGAHLSRGQVSVRIHFLPNLQAIEQTLPDVETLRALKKGWEKIAREVGVSGSIDLPFLVSRMPSFSKLDSAQDEDLPALKICVEEALKNLTKMKKIEGKALVQDIGARLKELARMLEEIQRLSPEAVKRLRQKLKERMEEIFKPGAEVDDRLLRELALFAEKVDVSEEITRFHSHLAQFKELINEKEEAIGRKMDFLVQEMGREINTIASKSSEPGISRLVVDMKSELEKTREQIQNIE